MIAQMEHQCVVHSDCFVEDAPSRSDDEKDGLLGSAGLYCYCPDSHPFYPSRKKTAGANTGRHLWHTISLVNIFTGRGWSLSGGSFFIAVLDSHLLPVRQGGLGLALNLQMGFLSRSHGYLNNTLLRYLAHL